MEEKRIRERGERGRVVGGNERKEGRKGGRKDGRRKSAESDEAPARSSHACLAVCIIFYLYFIVSSSRSDGRRLL